MSEERCWAGAVQVLGLGGAPGRQAALASLGALLLCLGPGGLHPKQGPHAGGAASNWITYSGDEAGWRFSQLSQIDSSNVGRLALQWVFQTRGKLVATPLAIEGILYLTGEGNTAYALDARTGRQIWRYERRLPDGLPLCCGRVNRGFAVWGDRLFMATLDAHVIALDARTGNVLWDVETADAQQGYSFTSAPLVVGDKVLVGVAGGEYGVRGFIDAYQAKNGRRAWRFHTVPGPGEVGHESWEGDSWKTGGAPAWFTGTYDANLDLVYWGTGNPAPVFYGGSRGGDNLFSNSLVALDPDTGDLRWHFQFTPHDVHDRDAVELPVLLNLEIGGRLRKVLVQANRNGFLYVLDRVDGTLILAKPFVRVTWARSIGGDGKPIRQASADAADGDVTCPGLAGGTNWMSPSYSPFTGLFYVQAIESCDVFRASATPPQRVEGEPFAGGIVTAAPGPRPWGALRAIDPRTGELEWEFRYYSGPSGGTLATAGGLVFAAGAEGQLIALEARSGAPLWHVQTGATINASPMTYSVAGRQYVALAAGEDLFAFALPSSTE